MSIVDKGYSLLVLGGHLTDELGHPILAALVCTAICWFVVHGSTGVFCGRKTVATRGEPELHVCAQLVHKTTPKKQKVGTKNGPCSGYGIRPRAPVAYYFMEATPKQGTENGPRNGVAFLTHLVTFFLQPGWPLPSSRTACRACFHISWVPRLAGPGDVLQSTRRQR